MSRSKLPQQAFSNLDSAVKWLAEIEGQAEDVQTNVRDLQRELEGMLREAKVTLE